jgi:hypothetical protein
VVHLVGLSARTRAFLGAGFVGSCLLSLAIVACVGEDPDSVGGSSSGDTDAALPDAPSGADASVPRCVSAPPSDWQGPVAVRLETDPTGRSCDPSWSTPVALAGVGTPGGPATCAACTCSAAAGAVCPAKATLVRSVNDGTCATDSGTYDSPILCNDLGGTVAGFTLGVAPAAPMVGACGPDGGAPTVQAPAFGQYARVCATPSSPPSPSECEGKLLVPGLVDPSEWALCIYQPGDVASCPLGSQFTNGRLVAATKFADDRGCTKCECTPPSGVLCSAYTTHVFGLANCSGSPVEVVAHDGNCSTTSNGNIRSLRLAQAPTLASEGSCTPLGGVATGEVATSERITLCCLAP